MVMRIGGLASGMDIDELVKKLMSAERAPLNKLFQSKQRYEWQRDAYRDINKKLKTFDTYIADNLVLKTLNSKTASSSNSNLVSSTATGSASGTVTIEGVSQLAEAARITGGQVNANGSTKMSELASGIIEFKAVQKDGKMAAEPTGITITEDMTVNDFIKKVNESNAGVSAVFESGRFSFTAKNTGKSNIEITGDIAELKISGTEATIREGKNAIFQVNGIATERSTNTFSINGYNITLKETFNGERAAAERYNAAYTEWKYTSTTEYEQRIADALTAKNTANNAYDASKTVYEAGKNTLFGSVEISNADKTAFNKINNPQFAGSLTAEEVQKIKENGFTKKADYENWLKDDSTDADLKAKLKDANINFDQFKAIGSLDYDKLQSLSLQSQYNTLGASFLNGLTDDEKELLVNMSGEDFNAQINDWKNSTDATEKTLGEKLAKLSNAQKSTLRQLSNDDDLDRFTDLAAIQVDYNAKLADKNLKDGQHQALVDRQNKALADFEDAYKQQNNGKLDGIENAEAIKAADMPASSASPVTLTSSTNVDEMMTKIKDFVNMYNALIIDFNDQTKEKKYRDYAPLTAEQKEEMSENDIKLWEEKAKSGLLRSDDLIRNGLSKMRALVYEANPGLENSKFNTLFSIGITTSKNVNEGGTLAIDEGKLRKALEEDPDAVERLFKNADGKKDAVIDGKTVDTRGYLDKLRDSMKSFEVSVEKKAGRALMDDTQYSIGKSLKDIDTRIKTWQDKLKGIEARYWKQFSIMETAINKANQQSSMFSGQ